MVTPSFILQKLTLVSLASLANGYQVTIHINKDTEFKAKCCCVILEEKKSTIGIQYGKMMNVV